MNYQSKQDFKSFVDDVSGPAFTADMDLNITAAGDEFLSLTGYLPEEVLGKPSGSFIQKSNDFFSKVVDRGFCFNCPVVLKAKSGNLISAELNSVLLRSSSGEVCGIGVLLNNRPAADESAAEHLADYLRAIRAINSTVGHGFSRRQIMDKICENIVRMGGYVSAWIALTDESLNVNLISEYGFGVLPIEQDLRKKLFCYCMKHAMEQSSVLVIDDPLSTCGGCPISTIFGKTSAMTHRIEYVGRVYGVINVHAGPDIVSDRREQDIFSEITLNIGSVLHGLEMEQERARAEVETKKAQKIKSDFIHLISHRLRTPLTPVKEGINILLEGIVGEVNLEQKDILSTVKRNAQRLVKLVDRVVELEKLQNNMVSLDIKSQDPGSILSAVKEKLTQEAMIKNIAIRTMEPPESFSAAFDKDKISLALELLVSNAIKHTDSGEIVLGLEKDVSGIIFTVKDTGHGIPEEYLPRIFESFETSSESDSAGEGAGLGLTLCREIVKLHGGDITVESNPGQGSVFRFNLPAAKQ